MNLLSQRREVGEFKKRYKWMALAALGAFSVLIARIAHLQLINHEHYAKRAIENITKTVGLPATRGILSDTKGRIIATNRPAYRLYVTPALFRMERDLPKLVELMDLSPDESETVKDKIARVPPARRTHQVELFSDINRDQLAALETHSQELPGVDVVAVPVRVYPYGNLASHAIGYLNEADADELRTLKTRGYRLGDRVGRTGIERAWESYVRGRSGYRRSQVDVQGKLTPHLHSHADQASIKAPVPGRDLTLTLDMELMRTVERALRGHPSGAAVVVEVHTGRIRALFSKPSYDLNEMSGRLSRSRHGEMTTDPFRPLIDKTIYESYFPGSTFKPIAALAALQDGVVDPSARVDCPGYFQIGSDRKRCTSAHADVDMRRAIVQSCNVYFWTIAQEIGLKRLNRFAREFGFGKPTGIGINSEANGFLPSRQWYAKQFGRFRVGYTLDATIGQGNTRVTLVQLAMAYAAIANRGKLYVPQLIERVSEPDGTTIEEFEPRVRSQVSVAAEHLDYVIDGLYGGVNDPMGTAHDARVEGGVPVAGKTGTAQVAHRAAKKGADPKRLWYFNRDHAWFAGFAPAGDPQVAVVVLVEHGGSGGRHAAPIAMQILQQYLGGDPAAALAQSPAESRHRVN